MNNLLTEHEAAFDLLAKLHRKAIAEGKPGYYAEMVERARIIERVRDDT